MTANEVSDLLNKKSGVLGITEEVSDMRELDDGAMAGTRTLRPRIENVQLPHQEVYRCLCCRHGWCRYYRLSQVASGKTNGTYARVLAKDLEFLGIKIDIAKDDGLKNKEMHYLHTRLQGHRVPRAYRRRTDDSRGYYGSW
jgi:acetate kinase